MHSSDEDLAPLLISEIQHISQDRENDHMGQYVGFFLQYPDNRTVPARIGDIVLVGSHWTAFKFFLLKHDRPPPPQVHKGPPPEFPGGTAPAASLRRIEPMELADMTLVVDGARDWLGPMQFADEYPEIGQGTNSVSFVGVKVRRKSLRRWLADLSGKASDKRRGPRDAYPWKKIEAKLIRLMDHHGDFSADDPEWNAQARLEQKLMVFCEEECRRSPSPSQLRTRVRPWLAAWRTARK